MMKRVMTAEGDSRRPPGIADQNTRERDYWLTKFSGELIKTGFPFDYNHRQEDPNIRTVDFARFRYSSQLFFKLMKLANDSDLRLHIIMVAGAVALLERYTGNKDIIVGVPIYKQDLEEGEFVNTVLALRNQITDRITFKELLLQVSQVIYEAVENQNYPIESLLFNLNMPFCQDEFPLFDVAVLLDNIHDREYIRHIDLNWIFSFLRTDESIEGEIEFNSSHYKRETVERIASHFLNLLNDALLDINTDVFDIDILSEEEKRHLLFDFNDTAMKYPADRTLNELFEGQVKRTPDNVAVIGKDLSSVEPKDRNQFTYTELNKRSNQLARVLREKGVKQDIVVGIMTGRCVEMIIGLLGILKSGGGYLPIDPADPADRVSYMLEDGGASLAVTQRKLRGEIKFEDEIIEFEDKEFCEKESFNVSLINTEDSLAYIIYTSGSTGEPKGVMIDHKNVVAYLNAFLDEFGIGEDDVVIQQYSYSFDAFVEEVYPALLRGGRVVIPDKNEILDINFLSLLINRNNITLISCSPLLLNELNRLDTKLDSIHTYISGGDVLRGEYIDHLLKTGIVYNTYGPTETTVCATYFKCSENMKSNIPIGKPIANYEAYVTTPNNRLQPIGVAGELCVGGKGVSRGYLKREELTSEKFITNPFKGEGRLYRTGDLARWLDDGNLEFLGRMDSQVKIRGFRIEPGEIESQLIKHDRIQDAVVILREESAIGHYLCAYYVSEKTISVSELKEFLLLKLPHHMIPSYFIPMGKIPLNSHGKTDRKALLKLDVAEIGEEYAAPENDIEKRLVEIWQEVLGIGKIGVNDNFFEIGGQSLLAMKLISMMNRALDEKIQIIDLFRVGTIRGIAEIVRGLRSENGHGSEPLKVIRPFDLACPPLFRASVVKIPADRYLLYLDMHQIITEDISMDTMKEEFLKLYAGEQLSETSALNKRSSPKQNDLIVSPASINRKEWQLITLSARTQAALDGITQNLVDFLRENPQMALADVAYALQMRGRAFKNRRIAVCSDIQDAVNVLSSIDRVASPDFRRVHTFVSKIIDRPVIFMFSAQGSQYVNMGLELYQREPLFHEEMDRCFDVLKVFLGTDVKNILYPQVGQEEEAEEETEAKINDILYSGPLKFIFEYSLATMLMKLGIRPKAMIGHSLGEYLAACLSGVLSFEDALSLVVLRGELMKKLPTGAMMYVSLSEDELRPLLDDDISLAAVNAPSLCIVSGLKEAVDRFEVWLRKRKYECLRLNLSTAGHSKEMNTILRGFAEKIERIKLNEPKIPYIAGLTGKWITPAEASDPKYWEQHLVGTVRFSDGVKELLKEPNCIFIQVGPDKTLPQFVNQHLDSKSGVQIMNLVKYKWEKVSDVHFTLRKLGRLWLAGINIDWSAFHAGEKRDLIRFPQNLFKLKRNKRENPVKDSSNVLQPEPDVLNPYLAPRNPLEQVLVNICRELFGFDRIGVEDDFFELGGDSLKAVAFGTLVHKELNVRVPLTEFFSRPTVRELAEYINSAKKSSYIPLNPTEMKEYYVLSSAQKRIYFLQQMDIDGTYYNVPYVVTLEGRVDEEKLQRVFAQLIERHESFRTSFDMLKGEPVQKTARTVNFSIEYYKAEREDEVEKFIDLFIRAFELTRPPLLRAGLIRVAEEKYILMVDMHHIVSDGISVVVLIKEFMKLYDGEILPAMRLHYKAFSEWQDREKDCLINQREFWLKEFAGDIPVLRLPTDFERPEVKSFEGSRLHFYIEERETTELKALAQREEATLFMVVLAIFNVLLFKLSGQKDIVVGSPVAGRMHSDLRNIIGMFVNTVALRNFPEPEKRFVEFLREIKERTIAAFENQDYQFEDLVDQVRVTRDLGRNPLFDVLFTIYKLDTPEIRIPGLKLKPLDFADKISKFDITFIGKEEEDKLLFTIEYCTKLFKEETIEKFIRHFRNIVSSILKNPEKKISEIEPPGWQVEKKGIWSVEKGAYYPLSAAQKEIFNLNRLNRQDSRHNNPETITLEGGFDESRIQDAFKNLIQRHEALRKSFEMVDGEIVQKIHENIEFELEFFEASDGDIDKIIKGDTEIRKVGYNVENNSLASINLEKRKRRVREI